MNMEPTHSEIDVDRLMHEIRDTVSRQQQAVEKLYPSLSRFAPTGESKPHPQIDSSPLNLQPEFQLRHDNRYHVNDLLKYHGGDFVRNAYRALLRREPDAQGWAACLDNLASGRLNKVDILASLHFSPEGQRAKVKLDGLAAPAAIRRLGRLPVVGYLIQLMIAVLRLPLLLRNQRESEFYLSAQQQRIVDHSNQVNEELAESLAQVSAQTVAGAEKVANQQQETQRLMQQLSEQRQELLRQQQQLTQHVAEQEQQKQELLKEQQQLAKQAEQQIQQLIRRQQETQTELVMQERRLALLLEAARKFSPGTVDQSLSRQMATEEDHLLDALYASFEDQFRGEREEIKNRLRVYLPLLKDAKVADGVLDVGSGRGEWLEILQSEGLSGRGVDHNRVFVDQCRQRGLDVVEEDAITYLRSLPDNSLNAVTSFHLVEHLPFEVLIKLLDEIVRTLRSGGLLILETPNPENFVVGSCSFYADPTHRNPIPSQTLQFLLESRGLGRIKVMKLRPWDAAKIEGETEIIKRFNEYFYSAPDYGIIGWKV
ncbi:MAG: methyltransferase domain-containing protein [Pyrinomonadaceae bacterium]